MSLYCEDCEERGEAAEARVDALAARLTKSERDRPALLACEAWLRDLDLEGEDLHSETCRGFYDDEFVIADCDCYRRDVRRLIAAIDAAREGETP